MADYLPLYEEGSTITRTASADVTGGQLVEVTTSGSVGPAGAASTKVVGVAARDVLAGNPVPVYCGGVQRVVAATGGVSAGDVVSAAAAGTVAPVGGGAFATKIGIALTTAVAGATAEIRMV